MNANLNFSELNLEPRLQSAIDKLGYKECTPIQSQVIPHILAGKDVSGLAQTGTGKTAAFLIPLMDRIIKQTIEFRPPNFVLILVPTRELAEQVCENVEKLSEFSGLKGIAVYGGTGYDKQKEAFKNNVEFVVATPGRLIDLYKEHFVDLKQVRAVVFDEADRMFDMGFKDDMKYILQRIPRERQFLVFSATMNFDVLNTAYQFGAEPVEVNISKDQAKAENVKDEIFHVGHSEKPAFTLSILKKYNPRQVIIFSNFKFNVERIARFLTLNGVPAMGISSLLSQSQRNRVIELFKAENEKNILVATDVAARGLDIQGVDMVINFDLPMDAESYVHRIGRTGRAGAEGVAYSLVGDKDVESLSRIEEYLKHKLPVGWIEEAEIVKEYKPMPSEEEVNRRSGNQEDRPRRDNRDSRDSRDNRDNREGRRDHRHEKRGDGRRDHRYEKRSDGPRDMNREPRREGADQNQPENRREHRHPKRNDRRHGQGQDQQQRSQAQGQQGKPQHQRHGQSQGGKHPQKHGGKHSHHKQGAAHQAKPSVAKKSTMQKVTGFFKKIFGS